MLLLFILNGAKINAKNNKGETPLHWAAFSGNAEVVTCLVESGAKILFNKDGETPLHWAIEERHEDVIRKLMPLCGSFLFEHTRSGETLISLAEKKNCLSFLKV